MPSVMTKQEMLEEAARLERQAEVRQKAAEDLRLRSDRLGDGLHEAVDWVNPDVWESKPAVAVRDAARDARLEVATGVEDLRDVAHVLDREADKLRDESWLLRRNAEADDTFGFLGL